MGALPSIPNQQSPLALGLPHRPPFLFVRQILTRDPGVSCECLTAFAPDDPIFVGHFPGNPLVPGVLLTEALAQTAGIAAASGFVESACPLFLLSAIRSMKFPRAARPGDSVHLRAEKLAEVGDLLQFAVRATVDGELVAEGQLVLSVSRSTETTAGAGMKTTVRSLTEQ